MSNRLPEAGSVGDLGAVQIVSAGDYKVLTLAADKLVADVAKSRDDARATYDRKWCQLSGDLIASRSTRRRE